MFKRAILIALMGASACLAASVDESSIDFLMKASMVKNGYASLSVGIVKDQELIFAKAYGTADRASKRRATPETMYRIGSITKVFTTTLMCIMRDEGRFQLDDPIAKYLPADVVLPTDPRGAPAITFRHLATHSSGLPRMPANFVVAEESGWKGYTEQQLYEGLAITELQDPIGAQCAYSNLGVGLLGHVLTRIGGASYDELLAGRLLKHLGMEHTACHLSAEQQKMLATGYGGDKLDRIAVEDDFGCLAGCGDLASNVPDLAKFLSLQMRAGQPGLKPVSSGTLRELHTPQRLMDGWDSAVGLGWMIMPGKQVSEGMGDIVWHNGGTMGYFSWMGFLPDHKIGVIVLTNVFKPADEPGLVLLATAFKDLTSARSTASLPSAESVLDGYVEATGGREAYEAIKTLTTRGKMVAGGMSMTYEEYFAAPHRYYLKAKMLGQTLVEEGTDGQTVWQSEMPEGPSITQGNERAMMLRESSLQLHPQWRKFFAKAKCKAVTRFRDHDCYEIEMKPNQGEVETQYYDVKTKLLVGTRQTMEVKPFGRMPIETVYDDYRDVSGVSRPFAMTQDMESIKTTIKVESAQANVDIPADRFELPTKVKKLLAKKSATKPEAATAPAEVAASAPAEP